jgi:GntR family transcriptional regulator/MocR family aminotransferase
MYDMTIRLQPNSGKCLYEQIYEHIRQEIWEGRLLAGERLPSTRSLAEYLQVARSTVDYAYDQLQSEGYIEARPYKGYFVCPMEGLLQMEPQKQQKENRQPDPQSSVEKNEERSTEDESGSVSRYDFSPHGIEMSGFPFSVWKRINKKILNDGNSELFARGEPQGDYDLRQTISRYLHSSRGVNCRPEQIVVGAGNDYLLMLLEKILGRHVGIAMENPTYLRTWRIFQSFAYHVMTVPMDENGMVVTELEKTQARVAYVMPSHQFPTGTVMPIGRRTELLKWADEGEDRYLIEDDYDSEFRYRGKPIPSLQASDEHGKVIYLGTFSKAIAPAIRVSYMVLPQKLLEVYHRDCYFYSCTVSRIDQRVLNEFIRDGYFERHLNKMRKLYRAKHDLLLQELEPFERQFVISGEHGGLHLLLTTRGEITERELIERAAAQGVKVYGISDSCVEAVAGRATVLLGFGAMAECDIREGIARLKEAWL